MASTDVGHVNPPNQRVVPRVGPSPTLPGQYTYELECLPVGSARKISGHRYGANGPDIDGAGAGSRLALSKVPRREVRGPAHIA